MGKPNPRQIQDLPFEFPELTTKEEIGDLHKQVLDAIHLVDQGAAEFLWAAFQTALHVHREDQAMAVFTSTVLYASAVYN